MEGHTTLGPGQGVYTCKRSTARSDDANVLPRLHRHTGLETSPMPLSPESSQWKVTRVLPYTGLTTRFLLMSLQKWTRPGDTVMVDK